MTRRARLLFAAHLAIIVASGPAFTATAEDGVAEQDLVNVKVSNKITSAVWKRQPDSYALEIVLDRLRFPARARRPDSPQETDGKSSATSIPTDEISRPPAITVAEALQELVPKNIASYQPVLLAGGEEATGTLSTSDRSKYFIGNTIAKLRGLDPAFGCSRTLTLADGRRPLQGQPAAAPSAMRLRSVPGAREARVEVWLLKRDGSQIQPATYACGVLQSTSQAGGDVWISYGYSIADTAQAVAAAIRIDDDFYVEKLQPLTTASAVQ